MKILVTGGVGHIGGFMTKRLLERGDDVGGKELRDMGWVDVYQSKRGI